MYIVHSMVEVPLEKAAEVIQIYNKRSRLVDQWPGFRSFALLQNEKKPEELTVQIVWESKDSYMSWVTSDDFKRVHELEKQYPDQQLAEIVPKVTKYTVAAQ